MKNIVILKIKNGCPSGVVRYVQMLQEGLRHREEIKVHLVSLDYDDLFFTVEEVDGEMRANVPFRSESKTLYQELRWESKYYNVVADLLVPLFDGKGQLLWHTQELFLCELANILKKRLGGFVITHLHIIPWKFAIESDEHSFNKMYSQWLKKDYDQLESNQLEKQAYLLSDKIVCVSDSVKNYVISIYGVDPRKIAVVYNGLSDVNKISGRERMKNFTILFVGRVSREKGIVSLLNALRIVQAKGFHFDLKLVGHCTREMESRIHSTYKDLKVHLLGEMSYAELQVLYSECSVGIIPSLHEQCSYVAIEMSMFGMPMIVSDVDALSEMFEDGINALKIPLDFDPDFGLKLNEEKLAASIIRLMNDGDLRKSLSKNAIVNYNERFTLERMIENMLNLYESYA